MKEFEAPEEDTPESKADKKSTSSKKPDLDELKKKFLKKTKK